MPNDTGPCCTVSCRVVHEQLVDKYYALHMAVYPDYMEELRGIADGSGQDFDSVFLLNLDEELSYFITPNESPRQRALVRVRVCAPPVTAIDTRVGSDVTSERVVVVVVCCLMLFCGFVGGAVVGSARPLQRLLPARC